MIFKFLAAMALMCFALGCGVKGDPVPPDRPADLGRGRNSYKKAVQDVRLAPPKRSQPRQEKNKEDYEQE